MFGRTWIYLHANSSDTISSSAARSHLVTSLINNTNNTSSLHQQPPPPLSFPRNMTIQSAPSFKLLDGTTIPWLAWGNGTGDAGKNAVECGHLALEAGIRHIDTAQLYKNEKETGEAIAQSSLNRDDVYVTSKSEFSTSYPYPCP